MSATIRWRVPIVLLLMLLTALLVGGIATVSRQPDGGAVGTVKRHLEAMRNGDRAAWAATMTRDLQTGLARESSGEFGVLSLDVHGAEIADEETRRMRERYSGSDLARKWRWTDEFIAVNMTVVSARYTVDFDNSKVPNKDGTLTQDFILVRNDERSEWLIWDASTPTD